MNKKLVQQAEQFNKKRKRRKTWKKIVSCMGAVVVFVTTYMLILPAITMETGTFCGHEEHVHDAGCYTKVDESTLVCSYESLGVHVHGEGCFNEDGVCVCGQADYVIHTHNESCYNEEGLLICSLPERSQHVHDEGCYNIVGAHSHGDECYELVRGELICGMDQVLDHIHSPACNVQQLVCGIPEGHVHGEDCYGEDGELVCSVPEGHIHSEKCYESVLCCHSHTDDCYEWHLELICGLEESEGERVLVCNEPLAQEHVHSEECFAVIPSDQLTCTLPEDENHTHGRQCYGNWILSCGQEEHSHSKQCYSDQSADRETEAEWEASFAEVEFSGVAAEDVLAIAKTQLGYTESTKNYYVTEDGLVTRGYTRYGDWYGDSYGDWCAMFASFCIHYANVVDFPIEAYCPAWVEDLKQAELFELPSEYIPRAGDLVFFDHENDGIIDHVGLVEEVIDTDMTTIEGNSEDAVARNEYELFDNTIVGYGLLSTARVELPQEEAPEIDLNGDVYHYDAWANVVETESEAVMQQQSGFFGRLFSGFSTFATYGTRAASLDLTPYIESVKMYDMAGNEIASGSTVTEGDMIEFRIEYTIDGQQLGYMNGESVTVNSNTLTYKIPDTFQVIRDSSGNIRDSSNLVVGSFVIDSSNNTITLTFSDAYVESNAGGLAIDGSVSFYSTVTKITDDDGEEQSFKFTDEITLGIVVEESDERVGDLSVKKAVVNQDGDQLAFSIEISSVEGTSGPVTIEDVMTEELSYLWGMYEYINGNWVHQEGLVPTVSADRKSFTLTLDAFAPGETRILGYYAQLNESLLGADLTVGNTATVNSVDNQNIPIGDVATTTHTYDVLKKTHQVNADGSISWTITINEDRLDISGLTLRDIFVLKDGTKVALPGNVTVTDSSGAVVYNGTLPVQFPEGSTDTYVVTYTTSAEDSEQIATNRAILSYDDIEIQVEEGVGVGNAVQKSGELIGDVYQDADGTYKVPIRWTVTVNTYGGQIAAGTYFVDKMNGYPSGDMYVTYDQLMDIIWHYAEVIAEAGGEVGWAQAAVYVPGEGYGKIYQYDALENKTDGCDSFLFERFWIKIDQPIPEGKVLTFTYETTGVFSNNVVSTTRYANRFNINDEYEVEGVVDFSAGNVNTTKFAMGYYDPNEDASSQDWTLDYNGAEGVTRLDYNSLKENYLAWAIEISVPPDYTATGDVTIYEDLPAGVTVRRLDFSFLRWIPSSRLVLDNIELGNTYSLDFMLYTAEQHSSGNFNSRGTLTSIIVEVTESGDLIITLPGEMLSVQSQVAVLEELDEFWTYLYIYTQINNDFPWTPTEENPFIYVDSFQNKLTVYNESGDTIDVGSQTQIVKKDDSDKVLRKEASTDGSIITYSVLLNGGGEDLIENSSVLSIHDELTYTSTADNYLRLRLVPGSVKLYEANVANDGSYTLGNEISAGYQYNESSSEADGVTTWVNTIDMIVPDGKALVLVYEYSVTGVQGAAHNVANTCSITGVGEGSIDGDSQLELEVKQSEAQANIDGVVLYKVDANNDGLYLKGAQFNFYIWNEEQGKYILVHDVHDPDGNSVFTTNAMGQIVLSSGTLEEFAYNTAYYLVEIESPNGYYLGPEPFYFYIYNENTGSFPYCMPDGFSGTKLVSGDIIYRDNVSDTTEITIEKYWQHFNETPIDVTLDQVGEVEIELWQMLEGVPDSAVLYGTYTIVPDENGDWTLTITGLPKATRNADGTKGTNYLYYVKEVSVKGFQLIDAQNNAGINTGTIKLTNRQLNGYELPTTGGAGIAPYIIGGLLLCTAAVILLCYNFKPRRKEDPTSS